MFCNLALDGAEELLNQHFHSLALSGDPQWSYRAMGYTRYRDNLRFALAVRYADDMVVLTKTQAMCEESYRVLDGFLRVRGSNPLPPENKDH